MELHARQALEVRDVQVDRESPLAQRQPERRQFVSVAGKTFTIAGQQSHDDTTVDVDLENVASLLVALKKAMADAERLGRFLEETEHSHVVRRMKREGR